MNDIAFFMENSRVSYVAMFVTFGAAAALICSIFTAFLNKHRLGPVMLGAALSMVTGALFSRLVYWYCCPEQYDGIFSALFDFRNGGFSLVGVFVGVILAAVIVRVTKLTDSLPALLDCYAPGAALGIAVGRLGGFFSNDDKGNMLFTDYKDFRLPISVAVQDEMTGSIEWRFASFFWESMAGFAIFGALLLLMVLMPDEKNGSPRHRGDIFMTFISLFGATQATLESTRYDALHMRSNGFISMMQMASLVMLLVPLVYYSIRLVRSEKSVKGSIVFWAIALAALVGAGVTEYYVQRKANLAPVLHPLQMGLLLVCSTMTLLIAMRMYRVSEDSEQSSDNVLSIS